MKTRTEFAKELAKLSLTHVRRAIALLWYYRKTQEFEERTPLELSADLHELGFPKPNITQFTTSLRKSRYTIKGKRKGTFQVDLRKLVELDGQYNELLEVKEVEVTDSVLPSDCVSGTRAYLEKLVHQINGTYDFGFFDACTILCRRLMESLIVEIYIKEGRHSEIQNNGIFFMLDRLISTIRADKSIVLGRKAPKTMEDVKQAGDTAAHDRIYITKQIDIDDFKSGYRRLIEELLNLAGIKPKL